MLQIDVYIVRSKEATTNNMEIHMQCLSCSKECHTKNGQKIVQISTQSDPKLVIQRRRIFAWNLVICFSESLSLF